MAALPWYIHTYIHVSLLILTCQGRGGIDATSPVRLHKELTSVEIPVAIQNHRRPLWGIAILQKKGTFTVQSQNMPANSTSWPQELITHMTVKGTSTV